MLVLGMRGLNSVGYWVDEFYTLNAVKGGLGETLGELPYLPYYTAVWVATGGGACLTESCLRYPSVLAMVGAVAAVAVTARILTNRRGGLAAGLLMVMAPGIERYAQDARPYALGTLFVTLATLFVVVGMNRSSRWPWVVYTASVIGIGLVLPVGLAVLVGHAVLLWQRPLWRAETRRWLLALIGCIPMFALGAWALFQYSFLKERVGDIMVVHPQNVGEGATWLTSGGAGDAALFGFFAGGVIILALWKPAGVRWLIAALASVASIWLVSVGPMLWWQGRSLVPLAGLIIVGAAVSLAGTDRCRYISALVILALVTAPFYTWNRLPWSRGYDYRQAAMTMNDRWVAGDRVDPGNNLPWVVQWSLDHYTPDGSRFADDSTPSSGRLWQWGGADPCDAVESWDLGIGNTLRLCEVSTVGGAGTR